MCVSRGGGPHMFGLSGGWWKPSGVVLLLAGVCTVASPLVAEAQGFVTAVPSRTRLFPEISSSVTAMKRDSAGRYYVLATPANVIWIFSPQGKRIGQIPRAGADAAEIEFAVDFDLDPSGRVLVADRAADAVEIFSLEGSLIAKISVFAPTGVVALPDKQFAVSTLRSKRLVEIRNEQGGLVRSFGDPAEAGLDTDSKKLQNAGKISGDGAGDIYFAFAALPDPTVRKYDRFGYAAADARFAASQYEPGLHQSPDDRVQLGVNFREVSFSDSYNTWATIGNKGDVNFGGGLSPGLGAHMGGAGGQTAQSATDNVLSTAMAAGPGGGSPGGMAGGAMVSAQGSYQGDSLQLHMGGKPRAPTTASGSSDNGKAQGPADGVLQFSGPDSSASDLFGNPNSADSSETALWFAPPPTPAPGVGPGGGAGSGVFGGAGLFPGLAGFGRVGGTDFAGGIGGGAGFFNNFSQGSSALSAINDSTMKAPVSAPSSIATSGTAGSADAHAGAAGHSGERFDGPHGRYGRDLYNFTGTVKVNLDRFAADPNDKPVITAVGVDPVSQDIWAAIGRVLAHFDKNGGYLGDYYITTPEGNPMHASAIIVEPERLIVASDSRGIFEFARPDLRAAHLRAAPAADQPPPPQHTTTSP
jgi:hypothetical protein